MMRRIQGHCTLKKACHQLEMMRGPRAIGSSPWKWTLLYICSSTKPLTLTVRRNCEARLGKTVKYYFYSFTQPPVPPSRFPTTIPSTPSVLTVAGNWELRLDKTV